MHGGGHGEATRHRAVNSTVGVDGEFDGEVGNTQSSHGKQCGNTLRATQMSSGSVAAAASGLGSIFKIARSSRVTSATF